MRPWRVVANCTALLGQVLGSHDGPALRFIKNKHLDAVLVALGTADTKGMGNTKASLSPGGTLEGPSPSPSRGAEAASEGGASSPAESRRRTSGSCSVSAMRRAAFDASPASGAKRFANGCDTLDSAWRPFKYKCSWLVTIVTRP